MLYVIRCANHAELSYREGQELIVHLEADVHAVVQWVEQSGRRWAFSLSNAGARYAEFRSSLTDLDQVDWNAVASTDFRNPAIKEGKQAELLVHGSFPWELISRIGVCSQAVASQVVTAIGGAGHRPSISVQPTWYF